RNEEGLKAAINYFEKAIQKDPDFALAWAGLADTYNLLGEFTNLSRRELYPKAMAAVNRAMEIDNQLAEAHVSRAALIMLHDWDWATAGKEYLLSLELNPNYATGRHWYAEWLLYMHRFEEALQQMAIAVELDPVSQAILKDQGIVFYYTRQYDKAIESAMMSLELDPLFISAHRLLSMSYQGLGNFEKSIAENEIWGNLTGNKAKTNVALAQIYAAAGKKDEARKIISEIGLTYQLTGNDYRGMSMVYAALGEKDKAFEWLESSFDRHEESLCSLKVDPKFDPIRSDPRFDDLLRRIGLSN
ncbi:MAG: tetratricopeptide repeat protein, partial [Saprospiraceae bacterium]